SAAVGCVERGSRARSWCRFLGPGSPPVMSRNAEPAATMAGIAFDRAAPGQRCVAVAEECRRPRAPERSAPPGQGAVSFHRVAPVSVKNTVVPMAAKFDGTELELLWLLTLTVPLAEPLLSQT